MRTTTFLLVAAAALAAIAALSRHAGRPALDSLEIDGPRAQATSAGRAPTGAAQPLGEHSQYSRGTLSPIPDELPRFRAKPAAESAGAQAPSFVILDDSEPEARIDIGEVLDVEAIMETTPEVEQEIGPRVDADHPLAWSVYQPIEREAEIGEPVDADSPDALSFDEGETLPVLIGESRNADPEDDALWQTAQSAKMPVRDIGPALPVPDETTDPWTLTFE